MDWNQKDQLEGLKYYLYCWFRGVTAALRGVNDLCLAIYIGDGFVNFSSLSSPVIMLVGWWLGEIISWDFFFHLSIERNITDCTFNLAWGLDFDWFKHLLLAD